MQAIKDPDWGSELNSGNRSWKVASGPERKPRAHGGLHPDEIGNSERGVDSLAEHSFASLSSLSDNDGGRVGHLAVADLRHELSETRSEGELNQMAAHPSHHDTDTATRLTMTESKVDALRAGNVGASASSASDEMLDID